jgi:Zn-dependent M28 family amino/carboxypeptidase
MEEEGFVPVYRVNDKIKEEILSTNGVKEKKYLKGKSIKQKQFAKANLVIEKETNEFFGENVLAYIEGTEKPDELIIVTAHYDHIGAEGDVVFNGADDDGSGTVALMELAQAFKMASEQGNGPKRSILFMPVSGEETVFPLEQTVANLNVDMIGRLDEAHEGNPNFVYLIGSDKLSSDLHQISENANETYTKLELDYTFNDENDPNRFYYRSDHYNFAKNGIPVIFYFCGVHEDYHKETDTVDKIDFNKMETITKLIFHTAWDLANRPERIIVDGEKK